MNRFGGCACRCLFQDNAPIITAVLNRSHHILRGALGSNATALAAAFANRRLWAGFLLSRTMRDFGISIDLIRVEMILAPCICGQLPRRPKRVADIRSARQILRARRIIYRAIRRSRRVSNARFLGSNFGTSCFCMFHESDNLPHYRRLTAPPWLRIDCNCAWEGARFSDLCTGPRDSLYSRSKTFFQRELCRKMTAHTVNTWTWRG